MVRTLALRTVGGAIAGLVAMTGLMGPTQAQTGPPVPLSDAGTLVGWGTSTTGQTEGAPVAAFTLPQDLQRTAFSKVSGGQDFTLALTSAGKVVVLGESQLPGANISQIPPNLAATTVTDIVVNGPWAGAITSDGGVTVWGVQSDDAPDPTDVPAGLTGVAKLAIGLNGSAAAVKNDGEVVMWGSSADGVRTGQPATLGTNVKALVAGASHYYALNGDGNIVAWGRGDLGQTTLPASVSGGGNVTDIESGDHTGLALLENGSLAYWGFRAVPPDGEAFPDLPIPESLAGKKVVKIAAAEYKFLALDDQGGITIWATNFEVASELGSTVPSQLVAADIAGFSWGENYVVALVGKFLEANKAMIAGSAVVGQTLTGTAATFSGAPHGVTSQWLADGVAIGTGPSLLLTAAHLGKRITYATTATKAGEEPFVSTSVEVGPVQAVAGPPSPPAPGQVKSKVTFKANKVSTSKKKGKATVTVATASGRAKATGKATVTIKKGKTTKRIKVTLSGGKKSISLPKLKKGTWKVQVSYNGDKNYVALKSKSYKLKVKK